MIIRVKDKNKLLKIFNDEFEKDEKAGNCPVPHVIYKKDPKLSMAIHNWNVHISDELVPLFWKEDEYKVIENCDDV